MANNNPITNVNKEALSFRKQTILEYADLMAPKRNAWRQKNEIFYSSDLAYMRYLIPEDKRILDLGCGTGQLLADLKPLKGVGVDFSEKMIEIARESYPDLSFYVGDVENLDTLESELDGPFDFIILSDTVGYLDDCQTTFERLHVLCDVNTRLVVVYYSHLWEPILRLGVLLGLKMPQPEVNFLNSREIQNILDLVDFDVISMEWKQLVPKHLLGLGRLINRYVGTLPLLRKLCLRHYLVARSLRNVQRRNMSVTVLIPCRNERGNIENAVKRLPRFCDDIEVLFVEGNSEDGTFEECLRVRDSYKEFWDIKVLKQAGEGKGDAVREGFDKARGDVLMILDADLTVPPEDLSKFYKVIANGKGEFINGTRLVYPFEKGAMRLLPVKSAFY